MTEPPYTTGCGRQVFLAGLDICTSALGILEGRAETIRTEVLQRIPDEVSHGYGMKLLRVRPHHLGAQRPRTHIAGG